MNTTQANTSAINEPMNGDVAESRTAINGMVADFSFIASSDRNFIPHFNEMRDTVVQYINSGLDIYPNIRIYLTTHIQYHTINPTNGEEVDTANGIRDVVRLMFRDQLEIIWIQYMN